MKMLETKVRKKLVVVRMNDAEFEAVEKLCKQSTERNISSYLRKVSLQKPVTIRFRNQSADDFLLDMLLLKKELNAIGNNFNQAVHKLHLLDKIPEFRVWIKQYSELHQAFINKTEQINSKVNELYEQWLLK
jgi:hypothetical protein